MSGIMVGNGTAVIGPCLNMGREKGLDMSSRLLKFAKLHLPPWNPFKVTLNPL